MGITWTDDQLAVVIYAYLCGTEDLGLSLEDILALMGLTVGQWETRLNLDLPAQDGKPSPVKPIKKWFPVWEELRALGKDQLRQRVLAYLESREAIANG